MGKEIGICSIHNRSYRSCPLCWHALLMPRCFWKCPNYLLLVEWGGGWKAGVQIMGSVSVKALLMSCHSCAIKQRNSAKEKQRQMETRPAPFERWLYLSTHKRLKKKRVKAIKQIKRKFYDQFRPIFNVKKSCVIYTIQSSPETRAPADNSTHSKQ